MFNFFKEKEKTQIGKNVESSVSSAWDLIHSANGKFRSFVLNYDWLVYTILGVLLASCVIYYFYDHKRISETRRRRQELQLASQRNSQQRRPGASFRDHEIFQNAMQTTRNIVDRECRARNNTPSNSYVLRHTRSGRIYGDYYEAE
ncbi:uncharacterized protein LOC101893574 [Musca domestica]|uniref:Uncharacterized protein LOC101893574 n=1 Tax=Musca domestica TaxID=7370 RepID=A0A1I8N1R0_MUSDO|nr:uncharacterized protein LOC101893574 [Musca domestica]